jgi:hypothetical protein
MHRKQLLSLTNLLVNISAASNLARFCPPISSLSSWMARACLLTALC